MKLLVMLSALAIGASGASASWTLIHSITYEPTVEEVQVRTYENHSQGSVTVPLEQGGMSLANSVTGDSPTNGPNWSSPYATISSWGTEVTYQTGGHSIPGKTGRRYFLQISRGGGQEKWARSNPAEFATRVRVTRTVAAEPIRIEDYDLDEGNGNPN
ncbi:MAG TPA: hypothetical protein PLH94_01970 [Fimbriimonadaceae bacterium]|nr:hypothetical protein [Fimbriimonadaceae bacterium]